MQTRQQYLTAKKLISSELIQMKRCKTKHVVCYNNKARELIPCILLIKLIIKGLKYNNIFEPKKVKNMLRLP